MYNALGSQATARSHWRKAYSILREFDSSATVRPRTLLNH
jgi:hypothetical protein